MELIKKIVFLKVFAFTFLIAGSCDVSAQGLLEQEVEKAYHSKKTSRDKFVLSEKMPFQDSLPKDLRGQSIPVPGYLYSEPMIALPGEAGTYDGLPLCTKSQKRIVIRPEEDTSFRTLDIIAYQFDNQRHKKKARKFGSQALPYIEGALSNPYRPLPDEEQTVLRVLGLECLPTRVRSIRKDGDSAFEYSEGSLAWQ